MGDLGEGPAWGISAEIWIQGERPKNKEGGK